MQNTTKNIKTLRFIDLFAGIGGFRLGIEKAYGIDRACESKNDELQIANDKHLSNGNNLERTALTCVYSNEWDKYANLVYRRHYGECDNRDIRSVKSSEIPDFDLLCGGFPCQAFSVAGKRGGFDDTRGTLFFEVARILKEKQPRLLLLENVKGLLSHDSGRTFKVILATLTELGYDVQWQVLNSKNFGVPQNRERVYIVGHLRGTPRPEVFPLGNYSPKTPQELTTNQSRGNRIYNPSGTSVTIASQAGGLGAKTGLYMVNDPSGEKGLEDKNIFTLTGQDKHGVYDGVQIRRLTPIECERLQGFPDGWTEYGVDGEKISDTQRYKMMGNAVTTNVVTEVMRRLAHENKK